MKKGLVFERGFLSRCVINQKSPATIKALAGHPLWATVTHMEGPPRLLLDPVMRSLRSVVVGSDELAALCNADRDLPFETLRCSIYDDDDEKNQTVAQLARGERLPALRDLTLWADADAQYEAVIKGPVAERLERLCLLFDARPVPLADPRGPYQDLHAWLAMVEKHRPGLETLEMDFDRSDCWASHYTFKGPDARGRYTELEVVFDAPPNTRGWIEEIAADVAGVLDGLDPKRLRSLVLRTRQRGKMDRRASAVRRAAKRFRGIERLEVP